MPHLSVREIRQTLPLLPLPRVLTLPLPGVLILLIPGLTLPLPDVLTLPLPGVLGLPRVLTPPIPGVLTLPIPGGDLNLPPPGVHNLLLKRTQQIIKSMCCYQQKITKIVKQSYF